MKTSVFCIIRRLVPAIFVAGLLAATVVAQTDVAVLDIRGAIEQPLTLALSDLQAMPRVKLKAQEKGGGEATFEGVALYELVMRAKPKLTEHCCGNAINTVVVIKAADNYQATFSLTELDPKFGHREILLADRREGRPLEARQGPLEIIVPDETVRARWVRQVNLIEILSIGDVREASTNSSGRSTVPGRF
jgi:DMSO/TMAO reductase YedYZ molybdopterin-dependent catalytic subunit